MCDEWLVIRTVLFPSKVGAFLASQSDDRTVRVWRTKDWGCEKVISEPFEECGGTTHVLRLSWSPDGLYLVSAHAMNGGMQSRFWESKQPKTHSTEIALVQKHLTGFYF